MAQAWVDIVAGEMIAQYRPGLEVELRKNPDLWYPFLKISEILQRVDDADYQLWIGGRGHELTIWGLTEVFDYPHGKCIRVVWASGDAGGRDFYDKWCNVLDIMAQQLGAKFIEVGGRPGWEKIYKPHGYRLLAVTLLKEVEHASSESAEGYADEQGRTHPRAEEAHGDGHGAGG